MSEILSGRTHSERRFAETIRRQLAQDEVLVTGLRLTDAIAGDVEADVVLFLPGFGIAVVEVKGGTVHYRNGQWLMHLRNGVRRIRPVEQARRAKHALRQFVARQPEWRSPLPKVEWFVALPGTDVAGDMGPEGRRQQLIGRDDLPSALLQIRHELAQQRTDDHIPNAADIDLMLQLLKSSSATAHVNNREVKQRLNWRWAVAVVVGLIGGYSLHRLSLPIYQQVVGVGGLALVASPALVRIGRQRGELDPTRHSLSLGIMAAAAGVVGLAVAGVTPSHVTVASECNTSYQECLPIVQDLDCADVSGPIHVIGDDPYKLDRDGDGIGCEWNGTSGVAP